MQKIKLGNVSFNKLKEFISLGSKKNTTIKGKFTLTGEYELITKDGGDSMTNKQIAAKLDSIEKILNLILICLDKLEQRMDKLEYRLDRIVKLNNLKE